MLRNHFECETIFKSCANWWVQNFQCKSEATRWLHSLSSSCTLSSIAWVSCKLLVTSSNLFVKASFSSLHSTLMHFGGLCCFGCLPPKCGWAGTGSDEVELPRIWVIINSSCWAEIAISLSFFDTFSLPSGLLHDFLAFLALSRRVKTLRFTCIAYAANFTDINKEDEAVMLNFCTVPIYIYNLFIIYFKFLLTILEGE